MKDDDQRGRQGREWKRLATCLPFRTPWFRVRRDELQLATGEEITFHSVEHDGWALIVPLRRDGQLVMERVYRWVQRGWALECPAGGLDGEEPAIAARRELREETGYVAQELEALGSFTLSSGYSTERCHIFLATQLDAPGPSELEDTEEIDIELHPFAELHAQALAGELGDAPTSLAILLAEPRVRALGLL